MSMPSNPTHFYDFGAYRLDEVERLLWRGDEVVPLTPKAFEMLLVLVQSSGHVLTKDELLKRVWPDTIVEEANLSHIIYKLREALGENHDGEKFIETVPRRGYRFVAKVTVPDNRDADLIIEEHSRSHIVVDEDDTPPQNFIETSAVPLTQSRALPLPSRTRRFSISRLSAMIAVAIVLGAIAAGFYIWRTLESPTPATGAALHSIAVLPFKPLAANDRDESLEVGMADSLISRLSSIKNLKVRPFSAVRRYTKLEDEVARAGSELNVDAVLDGSIQKAGDRVRVNVRLVKVAGGLVIWTEHFDEKFTDIFAVQDAISRRVGNQLAPKLNGEEKRGLGKPGTANTDAYTAYVKGRFFFRKFTPADHQRAAHYFNEAIARDPNYALAYAGLGDTYASAAVNNWIPSKEAYPLAKTAVRKALELDSSLAEVHVTSGAIAVFYDLDWAAAEREYQQAMELNPNYPETYEVYSYLLSCSGRLDEGIEMAKRGLEVDPLSLAISDDVAGAHYWARHYDEAIAQGQKSIELDRSHAAAYVFLGQAYDLKGRYAEAIAAYQKAIELSQRTTNIMGLVGHAEAASGRRSEALKIVKELKEVSADESVSPYDLAIVYTGLGDKDNAINQLNRAYEERAGWIIAIKVEPMFDPLRSDPRFADLQRRMNYP
jgi:DNA-binding winged helix-turn-helix (wHTH) protein/TolB-like protein/tetratricopeptide (TPR) repeat protein